MYTPNDKTIKRHSGANPPPGALTPKTFHQTQNHQRVNVEHSSQNTQAQTYQVQELKEGEKICGFLRENEGHMRGRIF